MTDVCKEQYPRPQGRLDRGSTVVEFAMMAGLFTLLFLTVLDGAVLVYSRNVISAAAADGSRYAADAGVAVSAGGARAEQLIEAGLGRRVASGIGCTSRPTTDPATALELATVQCVGHLRLRGLAFIRTEASVDVTSSSPED